MNTEYSGGPAISQLCLRPEDISSGMYDDSTLRESSTDSLLNTDGHINIYNQSGYRDMQYALPVPVPGPVLVAAAMGLIPVKLDVRSFYKSHDHRSKRRRGGNIVPPQIERRRAQNRASQQAFRDRKRKYTKELEDKITELERLYSDLTQTYNTLQLEYSNRKMELEVLWRVNIKQQGSIAKKLSGHGCDGRNK